MSGGLVNKLDALLQGVPVLEHVMRTVKASGLAWHIVRPAGGTKGMGDSIALGVNATSSAAGWLILPGDLPLVQPETLCQVALALASHPVAVPNCRQQAGHPVGFGAECFDALACLNGDAGAAAVVRAHRALGQVLDLVVDDVGIGMDVDTVEDLACARAWLEDATHAASQAREKDGEH